MTYANKLQYYEDALKQLRYLADFKSVHTTEAVLDNFFLVMLTD